MDVTIMEHWSDIGSSSAFINVPKSAETADEELYIPTFTTE